MPDPARLELAIGELREFHPAAIYLIGSAARGTMRPGSDFDLAFLPDRACDPFAVFEAADRMAGLLGCPVDLIDLRRASTVMAKEVVRTGRLLDEQDSQRRAEFEMRALADYARLNEERLPVLRKLAAIRP